MEDILLQKYSDFRVHVSRCLAQYRNGTYIKRVEGDPQYQKLVSYYEKTGLLADFKRFYAFVKLIREIYSHPFINDLISFADSLGASSFNWIGEYESDLDWHFADQLARGSMKVDDPFFRSIGFIKELRQENWGWLAYVACIAVLKIIWDDALEIQVVEPNIIKIGIGQLQTTFK